MKNLTYLTLAIFCIFTFSACEEAEQGGCIDPYAENYESWADYDDSSCLYQCDDPYAINYNVMMSYPVCEYEGDVVFYLTVDGATYITNENVPFLDVYIGNYRAGTMPGNAGFTDVVLCNDTDPDPEPDLKPNPDPGPEAGSGFSSGSRSGIQIRIWF